MDTIKNVLFFLLGIVIISCENQQSSHSKTDSDSFDSKQVVVGEFYMDETDITSNEWRGNNREGELQSTLGSESIDNYYKLIYFQKRLIKADADKMLSITDSLFTKNDKNKFFLFHRIYKINE